MQKATPICRHNLYVLNYKSNKQVLHFTLQLRLPTQESRYCKQWVSVINSVKLSSHALLNLYKYHFYFTPPMGQNVGQRTCLRNFLDFFSNRLFLFRYFRHVIPYSSGESPLPNNSDTSSFLVTAFSCLSTRQTNR